MAKRRLNLRRIDPTRTSGLRRRFRAEMRRRFRSLKQAIRQLVVVEDCFGLADVHPFQPLAINAERQVFRFQTTPQKMKSFQKWFQGQVKARVLSTDKGSKPWTAEYVESAYRQGVVGAYIEKNKEALAPSPDFFLGGKEQFLKQVFAAPEAVSKIELLSTRAFDQLEGITAKMSQDISRSLADGLANGKGAMEMARDMARSVDGIERTRAEVLVRTEVIHAHAEGTLDSMEKQGMEEVQLLAEWSTANDGAVCKLCEPLEGVVMKIEDAHGLIPRHPNCRCAWQEVLADRLPETSKTGKDAEKAIQESIDEGGGADKTSWAGAE